MFIVQEEVRGEGEAEGGAKRVKRKRGVTAGVTWKKVKDGGEKQEWQQAEGQ